MFRNLPSFEPDDQVLDQVAALMEETGGGVDGPIPAGFTYLGQFIDHDVTFDPASSLQRQNDPNALTNFRTPRLDLDSLYGRGPNNDPFMYDPALDRGRTSFLIGRNSADEADLPRNDLPPASNGTPQGRALIGDPRNDENVIVSQLHLLFLRFHNKIVETLRGDPGKLHGADLFEESQRQTRWHYQWIVLHDFLPRVCGPEVVENILSTRQYRVFGQTITVPDINLLFYNWHREPFMPVEFSVAAYRFGHSMIRSVYRVNSQITNEIPIFTATEVPDEHEDLRGFRPLPTEWAIDWSFFFEVGDGSNLQHARKIDPFLASPLRTVPATNEPHELARRNLRRGRALGLPSGQRIARAMGIEPLSDADLGLAQISDLFIDSAPLWFYVLKEAEVTSGGANLGPVGGRLVAEVLIGLLKGDPTSFINVEPKWAPAFGTNRNFTMVDLVDFVNPQTPPPEPTPTPTPSWQSPS